MMGSRFLIVALGPIVCSAAHAITFSPFGPHGEGGEVNGQSLTVGTGGVVFEIDAFLHLGGEQSLRLSSDALPAGLTLEFVPLLSADSTDLTLRYRFRCEGASFPRVTFLSFIDAEVDEDLNSYTNEFAAVEGTLGAGPIDTDPDAFEVDEASFEFGDILMHFLAGELDNTNAISQGTPECVAVGLGFEIGPIQSGDSFEVEVFISEDGDSVSSFSITHADSDPRSRTTITYSGRTLSEGPSGNLLRGDFDGSGARAAADLDAVSAYLFRGGAAPRDCLGADSLDAADANDNERITVADFLALRHALETGGGLPAPSQLCGPDLDNGARGFDRIDERYVLAAGDLRIDPPTGATDRDLFLPVLLETPVPVTGLTAILGYDAQSLTPFDPAAGDGSPFLSDIGRTEVLADRAAGLLVLTVFIGADGGRLLEGKPGSLQAAGQVRFNIKDFSIVRPLEWLEEAEVAGRRYRSTVVDEDFADHHPAARGGQHRFVRGNSSNDTAVDITDPIVTLSWLFQGGAQPVCLDAADADNSSEIDITDPIYTLTFLFLGGPSIPPPFPVCGLDEGPVDLLGCSPCACPPYPVGDPCRQ